MTTADGSETRREEPSARCISSSDGELRVVQVGAGAAGVAHLRAITTTARCRLVAVADTAAAPREAAAAEFGVPTYEDCRKMLAGHGPEADIAVLVLPHHAYPDALEAVAEFDLHILKEKPFARNLTDAEAMAAVLQRHKGVYMTAGQRMFDPAFAQAVHLPDRFEILVHGTEGNLEARPSYLAHYGRRTLVETRQWPPQDLMALQLNHFLACLSGKSEPRCGLNESLKVQAVIEAAYQSAAQHHPVEVSELSGGYSG